MAKYLCLFLFYCTTAYINSAQCTTVHHISTRAIFKLQHFEFQKADSLTQILEEKFPNNPLTHLTRANFYWWMIITHPSNIELEHQYQESLKKAVILYEKSCKATMTNEQIFHLISIYAFKARLDLLRDNMMSAMRHLFKAIGIIEKSKGRECEFPAFNLTSGLYNYLSAFGAIKHPLFGAYTVFFPKGNMTRGIEQLYLATRHPCSNINTEAHYFLMRIYLDIEGNYNKARYHADWLIRNYPKNLIYLYYAYLIGKKWPNPYNPEILKKTFLHHLQTNTGLSTAQYNYLYGLICADKN